MITDADLHFHNADSPAFDHAETLFLIFSVPEARISGNAYVLCRPNAGICLSSVYVHQGIHANAWTADYSDAPMHVKCPDTMADFTPVQRAVGQGLERRARLSFPLRRERWALPV